MDGGTEAASMPWCGQPGPTTEHRLAEVDALLKHSRATLRFPPWLEPSFRDDMALAKIPGLVRIGLAGMVIYNLFLIADWYIVPDIIVTVAIVQLVVVSPLLALGLILIKKRVVEPEIAMTVDLMLVIGSIIVFYSQSHASLSSFFIFTIPPSLAFGNMVLPLPFRASAWFTGFCVAASSVAVVLRADQDPGLIGFAIVVNATTGAYMLIATFRMERSERQAYLVNLREKLRAELLDANNTLLRSLSETDALTGVANRRAFDDWCGRLWAAARDRSEPLSMLLVDIDHFKRLNDTHGHQAGDRALRCVAACLEQHAPPGSIVARYGGEEFAVLVSGGNPTYALACAEVLREKIERLHDVVGGAGLPTGVTVSIGLAMARPTTDNSCTDLLSAADRALYKAKATGRNRVVGVSEDAAARLINPVQVAGSDASVQIDRQAG